jgi:hypothetical protein
MAGSGHVEDADEFRLQPDVSRVGRPDRVDGERCWQVLRFGRLGADQA